MHRILTRQLKHDQLTEKEPPTSKMQWQQFLNHINNAYVAFDQNHYLSNRSQEISDREMRELNEDLKEAQKMAHLGSWILDVETEKIQLSKEACRIFGRDYLEPVSECSEIIHIFYEEDQHKLKGVIQKAIQTEEQIQMEARIKIANGESWVHLTAKLEPACLEEKQVLKGTILDITERVKAQEREAELNRKVIAAARQAGMAEIAASVLHNVGNVLNSVNVSVTLMMEKLNGSKMGNLEKIVELLQAHEDSYADFLINDPKGQKIPDYLKKLSAYQKEEQGWLQNELTSLNTNVEYIKSIVKMQQSISGASGFLESYILSDIIEEALQINATSFRKAGIDIVREYQTHEKILIDKSKLHQILLNILNNAKDALLARESSNNNRKTITLRVLNSQYFLILEVEDNGVGIPPENLSKIFSFGFTTKKKGHGFGLHSSALAAKEMGGRLSAKNKSLKEGAIFTLELPKVTQTT